MKKQLQLKVPQTAVDAHVNKLAAVPPLIKWTGGKRSQTAKIMQVAPRYERYIEPFVGGGAVLFAAAVPGSIASDIYEPLIQLWKLIQTTPELVVKNYEKQWRAVNRELDGYDLATLPRNQRLPVYFYEVRDRFNRHQDPLDLNFILRTCVNGIVRFNDRGQFNNSFHLSRRGMEPPRFEKIVARWAAVLKNVNFYCQDFEETLHWARSGDFVYMDPPYAGNKQRYIGDLDLNRFFAALDRLNGKGVKWALSFDGHRAEQNFVHDVPKELYRQHVLLSSGSSAVRRVLGGATEKVQESLYLNY